MGSNWAAKTLSAKPRRQTLTLRFPTTSWERRDRKFYPDAAVVIGAAKLTTLTFP
jgi:hypothetical protein